MEIFKKTSIIGLDIGSSSIKLAQFIKKEDGLHLVKADLKEIGSIDKSASEEDILSSLKELLRGIEVKKSQFILTIDCPKTCTRKVTAPYMPKEELRDGIRLSAKSYFPFSIDDASLDFEILGSAAEKSVKKYQLLVTTSPKGTIAKYLSLLNKLGIKPVSLIPVPLALKRVIEKTRPQKDAVKAVLDIGGRFAELTIFAGQDLVFCRKIPVGGIDLTKALTGALVSDRGRTELSLKEAEKVKREVGIPPENESKIIDEKISTIQILSMMRPALEQLAKEIERCFDYYREETGVGRIDSLVLFGGSTLLKGLLEFLSKELGVEVKLGSPLDNIKIETGAKISPVLACKGGSNLLAPAVGSALSLGKGINLLPVEVKEEKKRTLKRAAILTTSTALILGIMLVYIGMRIKLTNFQKRIDVALLEESSLQPQLKLAETQSLANKALSGEPHWEDLLKELSNVVSENIYLTNLSMEEKVIRMNGIIVSEEGEELLSGFILTLERGIFKNVKLVTTKDIDKTSSEFEIKCWVD